jgi:hypothetical protein
MFWDHHQYEQRNKTNGDLRTFTLLFYVILFVGLNWWWSQDIYFTVLCCFTSCFILMMISVHLAYCFMLFYFLFYSDGDLRTFTLLFYVVIFLVLYWWWSRDIYFTVLFFLFLVLYRWWSQDIYFTVLCWNQEIKQHITVK